MDSPLCCVRDPNKLDSPCRPFVSKGKEANPTRATEVAAKISPTLNSKSSREQCKTKRTKSKANKRQRHKTTEEALDSCERVLLRINVAAADGQNRIDNQASSIGWYRTIEMLLPLLLDHLAVDQNLCQSPREIAASSEDPHLFPALPSQMILKVKVKPLN